MSRAGGVWGVVSAVALAVGMVLAPPVGNAQERPKITGISHVRLRVTAYCKADGFYSEILGTPVNCPSGGGTAEPEGGTRALWSGQGITLNVNSLYASPPNPQDMVEQVGVLTSDVTAMRNYLASRGIEVRDVSEGRVPSFVVIDPEGHRIEFVERSLPGQGSRGDVRPLQKSSLIHAGWVVKDRDKMDKFYKDVLGFHVYWHGGMKDDRTDWVDMQVPDGTDWIEYMLNVPENADKRLLGIMNHIALGVPDVRAAAKELEARGVKLPEQPKIGRDGKWQLNLYDPDQTRVELMESTPVEKPCCAEYTGPHPKIQ